MNEFDLHREILRLRRELLAAKAEAEEWRQAALEGRAALERIKARVAGLLRKKRGH